MILFKEPTAKGKSAMAADVGVDSLGVIGDRDPDLLKKQCEAAGIFCPEPKEVIKFCLHNYFSGLEDLLDVDNGHAFFLKFRSEFKKEDRISDVEIHKLLLKHRGLKKKENNRRLIILDPFQAISFFKKEPRSLNGLNWYLPGERKFHEGDRVPALTWIEERIKLVMTPVEINPRWMAHWTFPSGIISYSNSKN